RWILLWLLARLGPGGSLRRCRRLAQRYEQTYGQQSCRNPLHAFPPSSTKLKNDPQNAPRQWSLGNSITFQQPRHLFLHVSMKHFPGKTVVTRKFSVF